MLYFSVFMFDLSSKYEHKNRKMQHVSDASSWILQELEIKKVNNKLKNGYKIC